MTEPASTDKASRPTKAVATRLRMIQVGTEVLSEKGFNSTGIDEILQRASAPKGAFYYYFDSKEAFGLAVIEHYERLWDLRLSRIFGDETASPLQRIRTYIEEGMHGMEKYGFRRGCLIGNLGQELGGLNEGFRFAVQRVFQGWTRHIDGCLQQAVAAGEVRAELDTPLIARYFWTAWEGAILQCKLERSVQPLDDFSRVLFDVMLRKEGPHVQ